jgi:glucose dehydrogenase
MKHSPRTRRRFLTEVSRGVVGGLAVAGFRSVPEPEVCVVGSGFAGTYLALRLVERGVRTVLIEAGGALPPGDQEGRHDLFPVASAGPLAYDVCEQRTIGLGGTSHKWKGVVTRLLASDFRLKSLFGRGADWPITYPDIEPYFCQAEQALGVTSFVGGPDIPSRSCPFPVPGEAYRGPRLSLEGRTLEFVPLGFSWRGGPWKALNLADVEIPKLAASSLCTVLPNHVASRFVTTDGRTIDHLEVETSEGRQALRARNYVIAAGAFESARLLLQSRSQWFPDGLGNRAGFVGRNFNDHPDHRASWTAPVPPAIPRGIHRTYTMNDVLRGEGLNACHLQLHADESTTMLNLQPELESHPDNRLVLDASADRGGRPGMALHFASTPLDEKTLARGRKLQDALGDLLGLDPKTVDRAMKYRGHPGGTCRMAADEKEGVVDGTTRVFGTDNLYVCGTATFPNPGTANPTLAVVALALRLGDHLAQRATGAR